MRDVQVSMMKRRQFLKFSAAAAADPAAPRAACGARLSDPAGAHHRAVRARRSDRRRCPADCARAVRTTSAAISWSRTSPAPRSNIGTAQAAKAAPDGYTVLITVNNLVINPSLFDKVAFDPYKDFDPVVLAVGFSSAFSVHPSVPAKTVKELIEVIRANPGQIQLRLARARHAVASARRAVPRHPQSRRRARALWRQRPGDHRGDLGSHADLLRRDSAAAPQARAGKLRVLAVLSKKPSSSMPEVPTIAAAGFPGMEGDGWVGALVPAGTPKEIVALLNKQINEIIALPEIEGEIRAARPRHRSAARRRSSPSTCAPKARSGRR